MVTSLEMVRDSEECIRWKQGRGMVYQLLIDFLGNPPSLSMVAQWRQYMVVREESLLTAGGRILKNYMSSITPEQYTAICEMEKEEYYRLFDSVRPIVPSLCESDYRSKLNKNTIDCTLDISNMYAQSGIVFNKLHLEQDDHISIELEYMAVLGDRMLDDRRLRTSQQALIDSQIEFLEQHLTQWIPSLADELYTKSRTPMYRAIGCILKEFLPHDIEMLRSWRAALD